MKPHAATAGIALVVPLWAGLAGGRSKPACGQAGTTTPQKVEGEIVRVVRVRGRLALVEADGKTHEFQAGQETLQALEVGDHMEARLRALPKC
jgi:hypothetical protein